tara:strand:- start:55 stop:510 length:456 start_codon:yes stop_codon:yes gene_type:complete
MIKLKSLLKEAYAWERKFGEPLPTLADVQRKKLEEDLLTEASKHGFDLTDFKNGGFQKVLKLLKIKPKAKLTKSKHGADQWEWKGNGILIVTGNDPITGKYATPGRRKDEKNYASYMGIEGKSDMVETAVELIRQYASYIKNESPGRRGYI